MDDLGMGYRYEKKRIRKRFPTAQIVLDISRPLNSAIFHVEIGEEFWDRLLWLIVDLERANMVSGFWGQSRHDCLKGGLNISTDFQINQGEV